MTQVPFVDAEPKATVCVCRLDTAVANEVGLRPARCNGVGIISSANSNIGIAAAARLVDSKIGESFWTVPGDVHQLVGVRLVATSSWFVRDSDDRQLVR